MSEGLTPEQSESLDKFRIEAQKLPDKPEESDEYYLRWLRARSFNVPASLEMFKKHLKWRKEVDADKIFEWTPPEVLQKYFPGGFFGEDRDGHPVYYDFYGNIDTKGFHRSTKKADIIKLKIYHAELTGRVLAEQSKKKGRNLETITAVINMENLSYQKQYHWPTIQLVRELFQIFGENYPERSKSVYIINAPRIFPMVYNIVKHFIEEDTKQKILIMGGNWQEELQQFIAPDQLPQVYGGTRCEPDPQCSAHINWGGDIPRSYYLINNTEMNKDDMEMVTISRGSFHQIEIDVDTKGTLIRWEYLSVSYDIGFGLFFKRNDKKRRRSRSNEVATIIPSKRSDSHVIPEAGFHECEHEGTYILKFDNTYSWTRTKEVRYSVQSLPPDPQMLEACIHSPTHSLASNGDTSGTMVGTTVEDKDEGSIENGVGGMSLEETVDEINH